MIFPLIVLMVFFAFLTACASGKQLGDIDFSVPARQSLIYCDGILYASGGQVTQGILNECTYIGTVGSSVPHDEIPREHLQDNGYTAGAEVYRLHSDSLVIFHNDQYWTYYETTAYTSTN